MKKKRTGLRIVLVIVLILVVGIVLLPRILSLPAVKDMVLRRVNASMPGKLGVEEWGLRWQAGIDLRGVTFANPDGEPMLEVPEVALSKGLLALLRNQDDLGLIEIKGLVVYVPLPEPEPETEETPLESARVEVPGEKPTAPPTPDRPEKPDAALELPDISAELRIRDGTVHAVPAGGTPETVLRDVALHVKAEGLGNPLTHAFSFGAPDGKGQVQSEGTTLYSSALVTTPTRAQTDTKLRIANWDLEGVTAVLSARAGTPLARGLLNGALAFSNTAEGGLRTKGQLNVSSLNLSGGSLKGDTPDLGDIVIEVDGIVAEENLTLSTLKMTSSLLQANASGVYGAGARGTLEAEALLDLAAVFAEFPETLQVQEGLQVLDGRLNMKATVGSEAATYTFDARAGIDRIRGRLKGQELVWDEPASASAQGQWGAESLRLDALLLETSFLRAEGQGDLNRMHIELTADVQAALNEMGKFIRTDQWAAGGQLDLSVDIAGEKDRPRTVNAGLTLRDGVLMQEGGVLMPRSDTRIDFAATVAPDEATGTPIITGPSLTWQCWLGSGRLVADRLKWGPQAAQREASGLVLAARMDLAPLALLMYSLDALPDGTMFSGKASCSASGSLDGTTLSLDELTASFAPLSYQSDKKTLREESVRLSAPMVIDTEQRSVSVPEATLDFSAGRLKVERLAISDWAGVPHTMTVKADAGVDVEQLFRVLNDFAPLPDGTGVSGAARAELQIHAPVGERQSMQLNLSLNDLNVRPKDGAALLEKEVTLQARIQRPVSSPGVIVEAFGLESRPLTLQAAGLFSQTAGDSMIDLGGTAAPDLEALAEYLRVLAGLDIRMSGREMRKFNVKAAWSGSEWLDAFARMDLDMSAYAERIEAFGLDIKTLDVPLRVENALGAMHLQGMVNGGSLSVHPEVNFSEEPPHIRISGPTNVLTDVALTGALANELLGRIHPVFKGASVVAGRLDLRIDGLDWTLAEDSAKSAAFGGEMFLREVKLGTSGLLNKLLETIKVREREIDVGDRNITFVCRDGRIESSPLKIRVSGQEIVLTGTVGLDETLDYVAKVPVTRNLVGGDVYPYLEGTTINVPIRGTLTSPEISRRVLSDALSDLTRQAARKALEEKAGDVLKRLFE